MYRIELYPKASTCFELQLDLSKYCELTILTSQAICDGEPWVPTVSLSSPIRQTRAFFFNITITTLAAFEKAAFHSA